MGAKSPFIPLHVTGKDGAATPEDVNRVQDQIRDAFKKVQQGGLTQVTSKDGTVTLKPKTGVGAVDLSVSAASVLSPGTVSLTLADGPAGTKGGTPEAYLEFTVDGVKYRVPAWTVAPASTFPTGNLWGWWKDTGFPSYNGSDEVTSNWLDQSPNGNDLAPSGTPHVYLSDPLPAVTASGSAAMVPASGFSATDDATLLIVTKADTSFTAGFIAAFRGSSGGTDGMKLKLQTPSTLQFSAASGPSGGFTSQVAGGSGYVYSLITYTAGAGAWYLVDAAGGDFTTPVATNTTTNGTDTALPTLGIVPFDDFGSSSPVYEWAVWKKVLTAGERTGLESYLRGRY